MGEWGDGVVARRRISAFLITAHPIETAHGKIRVPEDNLEHLLAQLRSGNIIKQALSLLSKSLDRKAVEHTRWRSSPPCWQA
jgi:hypothetical protein